MSPQSKLALKLLAAAAIITVRASACAQNPCPSGYRILSRHYDALLQKTWEVRKDCLHANWPARSVAVKDAAPLAGNSVSLALSNVAAVQPILVHAGELVRLWSQDAAARIEITGTAEQSARLGEHITVRISHASDDGGLTIQHIAGIVRSAANVEMAQ